jgi:hypothetical protein
MNPFAEFALRSVSSGLTSYSAIAASLGIERRVLDATLVELMHKEQLAVQTEGEAPDEVLNVTKYGQKTLADAAEIEPSLVQLAVNYDPLAKKVIPPFGDFLQPRELRDQGIREVPIPARLQPELHRLDLMEIERVVRGSVSGREQLRDVLALKAMRRFRVFRPAVALVYRAETGSEMQVEIAIDGQVSELHSLAFSREGLARRLGMLDRPGRSEDAVAAEVGKVVAVGLRDEERNRKMREIKRAIRAAERLEAEPDVSEEHVEAVRERAERAQKILEGAAVQSIETFEHPQYLEDALTTSKKRIIIVSPWLRRQVMNHGFMVKLEELLEGGVDVYIGWGISADERSDPNADKVVVERLDKLSTQYVKLNVRRLGNTHAKVLISDDRWVIVTSFNWLSFRGDPKRTFRDERGTIVRNTRYVQQQTAEWLQRFDRRSEPDSS